MGFLFGSVIFACLEGWLFFVKEKKRETFQHDGKGKERKGRQRTGKDDILLGHRELELEVADRYNVMSLPWFFVVIDRSSQSRLG